MAKLKGKVAIVTGASKGIGAAIAVALGEAGASVVVNYASSREAADRVVQKIVDADSKAIAVQANVSKAEEIERLFAAAQKEYGRLDSMTKVAAKELGPRNIRVNSIMPGVTRTPGLQSIEGFEDTVGLQPVASTPLGRLGEPEDIARVAVFLASDEAAWVTGEMIRVGGGLQ